MERIMIGQYTHKEMVSMKGIVSSVYQLEQGLIVRKRGHTYNYYRKESDGSWTNYDCRTKY